MYYVIANSAFNTRHTVESNPETLCQFNYSLVVTDSWLTEHQQRIHLPVSLAYQQEASYRGWDWSATLGT